MSPESSGPDPGPAESDQEFPERRLQFFVPDQGQGRRRRPADVLLTLGAIGMLVGFGLLADPASEAERDLIGLAGALPTWLEPLWDLLLAGFGLWVATVMIGATVQKRFTVLVDAAVGVALAAVGWWLINDTVGSLPGDAHVPGFFALAYAALTSARPFLGRPFRRFDRLMVASTVASLVFLGETTPSGAAIGLLLGIAAGGITRIVMGTVEGVPNRHGIELSLARLGLEVDSMSPLEYQDAGVFTIDATDSVAGRSRRLVVKVYGRDARDTQFLTKTWRAIWYRGVEPIAPSRDRQAEHEAFVTLLAGANGARVPEVVAVGHTPARDAVLVLEQATEPLTELDAPTATSMWQQLAAVHGSGLAVRDIALSRFGIQGSGAPGAVGFTDLSTASDPDVDNLRLDEAQLLIATAAGMGSEQALPIAENALGNHAIADLVPYLQPAAVGPSLHTELKEAADDLDIDELRDTAAELASVESPEMRKLRRVSVGSLVQMLLITFAAYAIISMLSGVDVDELIDTLSGATWGWVILALFVGQVPLLTETISIQGASARSLSLGPLFVLQASIQFVKLAVPSTAARLAMVVRYFQKQGVPPVTATSIATIETVAGFVVQVVLLLLVVVFGVGSVTINTSAATGSSDSDSSSGSGDMMIVLGLAIVVALVLFAVWPGFRHRIMDKVRPAWAEAKATLGTLRSPMRLLQLFGGNLATQLLFAAALVACVKAFGTDVNLGAALVVYLFAALLGGFMPVPGGIGVMEASLTFGLVSVGVTESVALAAAITFRIVTFYLPPLWGWPSFHWLQRNRYL